MKDFNPFDPHSKHPAEKEKAPPAEAPPPPPFEKMATKFTMDDLVYPPHIVREVEELLEEFEFAKELKEAGIPLRRRILLHGPSGSGKTSIAHALAHKLKMDLYYNSLADTLSSYMGESEKNIAAALEFTHQNKCVMLFDEFDSIASKRIAADHTGGNESNRLVNMLLVGFDQKEPKGLLLACTNLMERLDVAVLGRFDLKLEIPAATPDVLRKIAGKVLKSSLDPDIDTVLREHSSARDVTKACQVILRRRVIDKAKAKKIEIPVDGSKRIRELSGKKI
jgi:SpoVK/Ycf46/Vps4 family AAA+-type ATPase